MFTNSHANTPLSQSERAYCLSYFINDNRVSPVSWDPSIVRPLLRDIVTQFARESFRILPLSWFLYEYERIQFNLINPRVLKVNAVCT